MFVLLAVEVVEVEEPGGQRLGDGLQAVQDSDRVHRDTEGGVPELIDWLFKLDKMYQLDQ